jgi:hypothetical protein
LFSHLIPQLLDWTQLALRSLSFASKDVRIEEIDSSILQMNFKRLSLVAVQAIGLGLMPAAALAVMPAAALADNITDTTTFTGTVPGSCTYASGTSQTVEMAYSAADSGTFTGASGNISISCNFETTVTLGAVTAGSNPAATTNTATLKKGSSTLATSGEDASSAVSLGNTGGSPENVTIELTSTGASVVGAYSYTVVLTTLS